MLARGGFAASGVLHILIGFIAFGLARGRGGRADVSGAVAELANQPAGPALLWVSFAGCIALALWQAGDAIFDFERLPTKHKAGKKLQAGAQAVVYAGLAFTLAAFARGAGQDNRESTSDFTVNLMKAPGGVLLLVLIGAAVAVVGVIYAVRGFKKSFEKHINPPSTPGGRKAITVLGMVGYVAKGVALFVTGLLVVAMLRFNARSNPVPSKTTHNTMIEVAWTIIPVLILVGIAVPSFRLLFEQLDLPKADLTVKAVGKQWYWSYAYPDNGKFEFDSLMAHEKQPRMLAVDNELVVPVNKIVRVQVTGADVIHSFGVPAFGIKVDAIPGRLNETWFKATKTGVFYGQCSELCGRDHAFMPIAVRVVSEQDFAAWIETAKKKFASNPANAVASAADVMR